LLKQRLVSPSGHVTSVSAMISLPDIDQTKEVPEVMSFARNLEEEIRAIDPSLEVRLYGRIPMNNAFAESAQGDMTSLVPISFAVMFIVLLLLLKSFSKTFGTILVIFMSILV